MIRARTALVELLKAEPEWRRFFKTCCETSSFRLRAQTWQFADELKDRGHTFPKDELEDTLLGLARELLPKSPAAQWDEEWAHGLMMDALFRLAEWCANLSAEQVEALDLWGQQPWEEKMYAAGINNDPAAFREAMKGWERVNVEALEKVRQDAADEMLVPSGETGPT